MKSKYTVEKCSLTAKLMREGGLGGDSLANAEEEGDEDELEDGEEALSEEEAERDEKTEDKGKVSAVSGKQLPSNKGKKVEKIKGGAGRQNFEVEDEDQEDDDWKNQKLGGSKKTKKN
jgi:hypothetical protein